MNNHEKMYKKTVAYYAQSNLDVEWTDLEDEYIINIGRLYALSNPKKICEWMREYPTIDAICDIFLRLIGGYSMDLGELSDDLDELILEYSRNNISIEQDYEFAREETVSENDLYQKELEINEEIERNSGRG